MADLRTQLNNLAHHAYAIVGDNSGRAEIIKLLEETHGIPIRGNPDFFNREYENFTIDDARELKANHEMRPIHTSGKKIFILSMTGATSEAQNALLKLLEEPAEYAHFFLIIPSAHLLLPTVRSRVSLIAGNRANALRKSGTDNDNEFEAVKFIKSSTAERLEIIKRLMDSISKERKNKQDAITFLNNVESILHKEGVKKNGTALETIKHARKYLNDRSPSLKMLLEYVALSV